LKTQDSQKENKDNFDYEWDEDEEEDGGEQYHQKKSPNKALKQAAAVKAE
jgi:hypothetical protein